MRNKSKSCDITLQANHQVDELKFISSNVVHFGLKVSVPGSQFFHYGKLLSTEAVVGWALSDISKLSLFLNNTEKKFWLITDNYKKLTLLPYEKNIDLTAKNWLFYWPIKLRIWNLLFLSSVLAKNHVIQAYYQKIDFIEKACPSHHYYLLGSEESFFPSSTHASRGCTTACCWRRRNFSAFVLERLRPCADDSRPLTFRAAGSSSGSRASSKPFLPTEKRWQLYTGAFWGTGKDESTLLANTEKNQ